MKWTYDRGKRTMPRIPLFAAFLWALGTSGAFADQESEGIPEYVVKAGFIYNFTKYVDWPADAYEKPDSPVIIGTVDTNPFGEELEKALRNKTVKGRGFVIRHFSGPNDIQQCHLLFIPRSEKERLALILMKLESWPVLTVGEDENVAKSGGCVTILIEKEKPRLEVNPGAAEKARLALSSKLLKIATIVRVGRER